MTYLLTLWHTLWIDDTLCNVMTYFLYLLTSCIRQEILSGGYTWFSVKFVILMAAIWKSNLGHLRLLHRYAFFKPSVNMELKKVKVNVATDHQHIQLFPHLPQMLTRQINPQSDMANTSPRHMPVIFCSWRHLSARSSFYIFNRYPRGSNQKYLKEIVGPVFFRYTPLLSSMSTNETWRHLRMLNLYIDLPGLCIYKFVMIHWILQ